MPQILQVRFGIAQHGSMPVKITNSNRQICFTASYVPYDSMLELIDALILSLKGHNQKIARWNTEPIEYEFIFSRNCEHLTLDILNFPDCRRKQSQGELLLKVCDSPIAIVLPFWRALREVENRSSFEQQWQRVFPKREMRLLEEGIKDHLS